MNEIEFLNRCAVNPRLRNICPLLLMEISELLNEPEQAEQEPVAWMYEWHEGDTESTSTYCGSEKPFQEDEVKPFNLRPLYASPETAVWMLQMNKVFGQVKTNRVFYQEGYAQAEIDLKREPLTPQQISVGNQSTLNVTRDAFKQGVKYAEKAHGIGGGE